ncbi:hypothetical protein MHU86_24561 [Fragilaria crotonensis]|nr:hypothetical protein MHU86_24561 [Fragilaria crotonensis]
MNFKDNRFASASDLKAELFDQPLTAAIRTATWAHQHTVLHPEGIKTHFAFHHLAPARTWTAEYKTRMEGAIKVIQQEQVEEASSRTNAKSTELYHFGKMGGINDINTSNTPNASNLLDNIAQTTAAQGKTILKQLATDSSAKLLHPGPIFPHPSRPNKFTLMCCRSAYEGKTCTYPTCNFFHFPNNLNNSVSNDIKAKMVTWVQSQAAVEWTPEAAAWATPAGNSSSNQSSTTNSTA